MIHMHTVLNNAEFLVGNPDSLQLLPELPVRTVFDDAVMSFLDRLSGRLLKGGTSGRYPDVSAFAFWIRRSSLNRMKERFASTDGTLRLGRGTAFHVAPSNVPVNFAYSMVTGLLTGNANIVRLPSKNYDQISVISEAVNSVMDDFHELKPYITLVRYPRDVSINDFLSSLADIRIVWGGDATIAEIRKSPLPPRSLEITFADRYSIAVIDSDTYMSFDKEQIDKVTMDFYNDTYLFDQNACTSPVMVVWTGTRICEAKKIFWRKLHSLIRNKYCFRAIQAVNKLSDLCLAGASFPGCLKCIQEDDNFITRVAVDRALPSLMDFKSNSGFFFEYDCSDIMLLRDICNDRRCQTVGYIGNIHMFDPLICSGIRGVDRIVPVGHTMDFDLIWDGNDLVRMMSRCVSRVSFSEV